MKDPLKSHLIVPLYGLQDALTPALQKQWWDETEAWGGALGVPPGEVVAGYKNKPHRLVHNHGYSITLYRSRIIKEIESHNTEWLGLDTLESEWEYKAYDVSFGASFGRDNGGTICSLQVTLESLQHTNGMNLLAFLNEAVGRGREYIAMKYGFAMIMPRKFLPGGYAMGLASGSLPDELNYDCNAWMDFSAKECHRTLRNVYGYNILNANHLKIPVGRQELGNWIKASRGRGRIEPLGDGLFAWTFQEGDDQQEYLAWNHSPVVQVREELKKCSIFPWQKLAAEMNISEEEF